MKIKTLVAASVLMAGSSSVMAMPLLDDLVDGALPLRSIGAEAFTLTDIDGSSDDFKTQIRVKKAEFSHNLGIYAFTRNDEGEITIGSTLEILNEAKLMDDVAVNFDVGAGIAWLDLNSNGLLDANDSQANIGTTFGFYLDVPAQQQRYYSHKSLNGDGVDHLAVYDTPGTGSGVMGWDLVLAWEDFLNGGDLDYNDLVAYIDDVAPVPEPGTLALLGLGLLGLGAARRRTA